MLPQIYADWWYVWCACYFMNTHRDVFIVLKKSLKWIPVAGWVRVIPCHTKNYPILTIAITSGHAVLQFHISRAFVGCRSSLSIFPAVVARTACRRARYSSNFDSLSRRHTRQQEHKTDQQEIRRQGWYPRHGPHSPSPVDWPPLQSAFVGAQDTKAESDRYHRRISRCALAK